MLWLTKINLYWHNYASISYEQLQYEVLPNVPCRFNMHEPFWYVYIDSWQKDLAKNGQISGIWSSNIGF